MMAMIAAPAEALKREQIIRFVAEYRHTHGFSPSFKEIGASCGITSRANVVYWLDKLCAEKLLWRAPFTARSVQLTLRGRALITPAKEAQG